MKPTIVFTLSALSAALYAVAIAIFADLHRRAPETGWVREPVSNYAVGSAGRCFRVYGYAGTVAAALLAIQFAMSTAPDIPRVSVVCLILAVVFRIGVVLVPTDKPDAPVSSRGRLHLLFAIANFAASYTAIANATPVMAASAPAWLAATLSGIRVAAMYALAGVVITMLPLFKRVFGLLERVFLLAVMLWFLAANMLFLLAVATS